MSRQSATPLLRFDFIAVLVALLLVPRGKAAEPQKALG
jgi:hypothetical protein